jgi:hypothetical protein
VMHAQHNTTHMLSWRRLWCGFKHSTRFGLRHNRTQHLLRVDNAQVVAEGQWQT